VGTVAIGVAAVGGAALGARRSASPAHESLEPTPGAGLVSRSPNEALVEATAERSPLVPREEAPFEVSPPPSAAGGAATRPHATGSPVPDSPTTPRIAPATPPATRGHNAPSHALVDRPLYL
jgi:hypothetical protein